MQELIIAILEKLRPYLGLEHGRKYSGDSTITRREPQLVQEILSLTKNSPESLSLKARISLLQLGKTEPDKCYCGNFVTWEPFKAYWNKTCSRKCAANSKIALEKKRKTCLERYGVESTTRLEEVKEKYRETCLKRYGYEYPNQARKIRDKTEQTCLKRYGFRSALANKQVRQKRDITCLERYGTIYPSQVMQEQVSRTCLAKYGFKRASSSPEGRAKVIANKSLGVNSRLKIVEDLMTKEFWKLEYEEKGKNLYIIAYELKVSILTISRYFHVFSGLKLRLNSFTSSEERELLKFIQEFMPASKHQLENHELDIYVPSKNLAFEYNGLYWHSEEYRDSKYHLEKTLLCEKHGIRLVHIWEDDWLWKQTLMKRKIKALLGLEERRIFARKCSVIIPTQELKRIFYSQNHIKGDGAGSISYALQYEEEIVAMITFKVTNQGHDLNRFATSFSVPGGFSKLLAHFKKHHDWKRIYTFADRSWSQGDVYIKTGFRLVEIQPPTFYGVENYQKVNRLNYIHERLASRFPDLKGTQFQIMDQAGIRRVWDCGQLKFEIVKNIEGV